MANVTWVCTTPACIGRDWHAGRLKFRNQLVLWCLCQSQRSQNTDAGVEDVLYAFHVRFGGISDKEVRHCGEFIFLSILAPESKRLTNAHGIDCANGLDKKKH